MAGALTHALTIAPLIPEPSSAGFSPAVIGDRSGGSAVFPEPAASETG